MKEKLKKLADQAVAQRPDAFMVCGCAAISYGAHLVYAPAGWIVGGFFMLAVGWLDSKAAK